MRLKILRPFRGSSVAARVVDHCAQRRSLRLEQGRLRRHFDTLADLADRQRRIDAVGLVHLHRDILSREMFEAGLFHVDLVLPAGIRLTKGDRSHRSQSPVSVFFPVPTFVSATWASTTAAPVESVTKPVTEP